MSLELLQAVLNPIDRILKKRGSAAQQGAAPLAAFDADGTLWPGDVNDRLLHYQAKNRLRDVKDLLDREQYREEKRRAWRCREFARRQAGLSIEEIRGQLRAALREEPLSAFPFQVELMSRLKERGFRIFIVSASLQWLVEETAEAESLPVDGIIGIRTRLHRGKLTNEIQPPVTTGEGKREAFFQLSGGEPPLFAAGDSPGDRKLLESAALALLVRPFADSSAAAASAEEASAAAAEAGKSGEDRDSGSCSMLHLARQKGWLQASLYTDLIPFEKSNRR